MTKLSSFFKLYSILAVLFSAFSLNAQNINLNTNIGTWTVSTGQPTGQIQPLNWNPPINLVNPPAMNNAPVVATNLNGTVANAQINILPNVPKLWSTDAITTYTDLFFQIPFTLTTPSRFDITVQDDNYDAVYLNGVLIGQNNNWQNPGVYSSITNPAIRNLLVCGLNRLVIRVHNEGGPNWLAVQGATAPLNPTITATNSTICEGGSTTLTVNPAGANYLWSNGATTQSITVSPTSTTNYSVTVTSGCQTVLDRTIVVNPKPQATISNIKLCSGAKGTLTAYVTSTCTGPYTYQWSNGQTTQSANVTTAGNYCCTITCSATGCSTVACATVFTIPGLQISLLGQKVTCNGTTATVSIDINVTGGILNYSYLWSNGATTEDLLNVTGTTNTYCVTVTDGNGCKSSRCFYCMNPCLDQSVEIGGELGKVIDNANSSINTYIEQNSVELKLYPNPVKDELYVVIPPLEKDDTISEILITNLNGVEIERVSVKSSNLLINTGKYPNGLYIVSFIKDGEVVTSQKIIKNN